MLLKGDVIIQIPRKKVWDFLTDRNQIGQCVPGVEKIETVEELKKYRGIVSVGLGPVKARFSGDAESASSCALHKSSLVNGLENSMRPIYEAGAL